MARKKKTSAPEEDAPPVFPTSAEIEEILQRRLKFWERPDHSGRYPLPVLDFLINAIGYAIESGEDAEEFAKDTEFYNASWYVNGITNGELSYSLYATIVRFPARSRNGAVSRPTRRQQFC